MGGREEAWERGEGGEKRRDRQALAVIIAV